MKRLFSLVALAFFAMTGLAAQNPYLEPIPMDPAIRTGVLPNGLTYFIMHNAKPENQAEFFIVHNVGAIQEEDSQQGLAHFLEHMAFNGTLNFPDKDLLTWSENIGVKFGENLNAFTGLDLTAYTLSSVPLTRESIIDTALLILHDWSHFISLVPEEIDNERGVIVEEKRTRNSAGLRMQDKTRELMLFDTKYAERNLIGYEDFLRTFDHQELRDFYYRWYRPDLQAVIVVGDFDVDMMERKVIAVMSDIPAVVNPEVKADYPITPFEGTKFAVFSDPELTYTSVEVTMRSPSLPLEYRNTMLANMISTYDYFIYTIANERLTDISRKKGAPFIQASMVFGDYMQPAKVYQFNAFAEEGKALTALEALMTEIEKIYRFGFSEAEFERAKTKILRTVQLQYDGRDDRRSSSIAYRLLSVFTENQPLPSPDAEFEMDTELVNSIDLMSLNAFVQDAITTDNRFIIAKTPVKEGVAIPTEQELQEVVERVAAMELEAPVDTTVKEPLIKEGTKLKGSKVKKTSTDIHNSTIWTLANGVKVVLKPTDFKADQILMSVQSGGGMSVLKDEDILAANLYASYVQRAGVDRFSGSDLQKQLAGTNVRLNPYVGSYENGIMGGASVNDVETMLQLTYLYLTSPRYSEEDFDVMMNMYLTNYKNIHTNPDYVFGREFMDALYDGNIRRQAATYESLQGVRFEQMKTIFDALFTNPDDFTFVIVGKFDLDTIKPLVEKYLGSLPKTKRSFTWVDDGVRIVPGKVNVTIETPMEAPKSKVAYVFSGTEEYNVKNEILFDALSSILTNRYRTSIREERGAAYSVGVMASIENKPIHNYSMYVVFDTNPELVDEVIELVTYDLEKVAEEGITEEELLNYKEFNLKEYADNLKDNYFWMAHITEYNVDGYDTFTKYYETLNNLSSNDIRVLAQRVIADGNVLKFLMNPEAAATDTEVGHIEVMEVME